MHLLKFEEIRIDAKQALAAHKFKLTEPKRPLP